MFVANTMYVIGVTSICLPAYQTTARKSDERKSHTAIKALLEYINSDSLISKAFEKCSGSGWP